MVHLGASKRFFPVVCDLAEGLPVDARGVHRDEKGQSGHCTGKKNAQQVRRLAMLLPLLLLLSVRGFRPRLPLAISLNLLRYLVSSDGT